MEESKTLENLLKQFYREFDPIKRGEYLEKLDASGYNEESCQKLRQLLGLRYKKSKQGIADSFMGAWLDLYYVSNNAGGSLKLKINKKLVKKAMDTLCLVGENRFPEELLYLEMKNLILCYITILLKQGGQRVMGFKIRSDQKAVKRRIKEGVLKVTTVLPTNFGFEKEFSILSRAVEDTIIECMGNDEPEDML